MSKTEAVYIGEQSLSITELNKATAGALSHVWSAAAAS